MAYRAICRVRPHHGARAPDAGLSRLEAGPGALGLTKRSRTALAGCGHARLKGACACEGVKGPAQRATQIQGKFCSNIYKYF